LFCAQVNIKEVQKCSNMKEKWLCLVRQHTRRHLVDRMLRSSNEESNLEADYDDLDEDENTSIIRRKVSQDEFYACDIGLRYPILQAARKRESLRMRLKASFFLCFHV
jgi:hypothetical protein